jgi:microcystin-dependent protein
MPLETATYINQLVVTNPAATDPVSQADDHMRLIKSTLKNSFANFTGATIASTEAQIDAAVKATVLGTGQLLAQSGSAGAPGISFQSDPDTGLYNPAGNTLDLVVGGTAVVGVTSTALNSTAAISKNSVPINVPIGMGAEWYSDTLPSGDDCNGAVFMWANGAAISRTTYATLFARIGTTWGAGDGSTTFNLPNLCEVVTVGKTGMGGAATRSLMSSAWSTLSTLGAVVGTALVTLTTAQMPAHVHTLRLNFTDPGHFHFIQVSGSGGAGNFAFTSNSGGINVQTDTKTTGITVSIDDGAGNPNQTASAGGGGSHSNTQPTVAVNKIIRVL